MWLTRTWLDGTAQYLGLFAGKNTRLDVRPADSPNGPPSVNISRIDPSKNATIKFESTFNFTASLRGLGMDDLFASEGDTEVIAAIRAAPDVVDQLAFLAYESEFLAGGWRFLTCTHPISPRADMTDFGRDTLLAMQVLLPVLSPTACEGILAGVIQRTGPDGQLCHEETVGLLIPTATYARSATTRASSVRFPAAELTQISKLAIPSAAQRPCTTTRWSTPTFSSSRLSLHMPSATRLGCAL